jgi:hypothetical protein
VKSRAECRFQPVVLFVLHPPDITRKIDSFFLLVIPSVSPKKQGVPEIIGPQLHLGQVLISRMASSPAMTLLSNRRQYDDFTIEGVHHMQCRRIACIWKKFSN